jgi:hypothetical protein
MKSLLTTSALLTHLFGFSQVEGIVVHSQTKAPIPYVNIWVEGEENGTTADLRGRYRLDIDGSHTLIFSAVGFETTRISTDSLTEKVLLDPSQINLDEVVIMPSNVSLEKVVGDFNKSKIKSWRFSRKAPNTAARYFEYKQEYEETPFLNKLRIVTKSHVKNAKFNIKLYRPDESGAPGEYLCDQNIFGFAKKLKQYTEIDLSDLNIVFPENGLFVSVEWLIIEENEYRYKVDYTDQNGVTTMKKELINYEPRIGTLPAESDEFAWFILKGSWEYMGSKIYRFQEPYDQLGRAPAIELTLTNQ